MKVKLYSDIYFKVISNISNQKFIITGKFCLVIGDDFQIYRSQIVKLINENETQVVYIDYGLVQVVSNLKMFNLIKESGYLLLYISMLLYIYFQYFIWLLNACSLFIVFLVPPFAIPCVLNGVEFLNENLFQSNVFNEYVINKEFKFIFTESAGIIF